MALTKHAKCKMCYHLNDIHTQAKHVFTKKWRARKQIRQKCNKITAVLVILFSDTSFAFLPAAWWECDKNRTVLFVCVVVVREMEIKSKIECDVKITSSRSRSRSSFWFRFIWPFVSSFYGFTRTFFYLPEKI